MRDGLLAGCVAAAATGGLLAGFGRRAGTLWSAFADAGHLLLRTLPDGTRATELRAGVVGAAQHVSIVLLWGVLLALAAGRLRAIPTLLVGLAISLAAYVLDLTVLPPPLRVGNGVSDGVWQVCVHLMLGVALAIGMRLAPFGLRSR